MANRITKKPQVARQYEISQNHIDVNSTDSDITRVFNPGGLPDMPALGLSPDNRPHINRGEETSHNDVKSNELYLGLETIDEAIFYYFDNVIKPTVISNGDLINIPLIYGSGERWKMVQKDGYYRDKGGKIQTPLIMVKRESIEKRRDLGNKLDANNPQLHVSFQERYTKRNQYDSFDILNNRIPQKELTGIVVPDYVNITYQGVIWADYISQLNKVIEAINYASDAYWGDSERFKFMAQIDQFTNINELNIEDNRVVKANFTLKLQGYIIPENIQRKINSSKISYTKSQLVVNQTTVTQSPETISVRGTKYLNNNSFSSTTSGGSGGSSPLEDDDWLVREEYLQNIADRNIFINGAFLSVDIGDTKTEDIFLVKKSGNIQLKVDNDGLLSLKNFTSSPEAKKGGVLFMGDDFYVGL